MGFFILLIRRNARAANYPVGRRCGAAPGQTTVPNTRK